MRTPQNHLAEAQQRLGVANHLLGRTYPVVKDARILLATAKELYASVLAGMTALLEHDKRTKRIPALVQDIDSRFELFQESLEARKLDPAFHKLVIDLHSVIVLHEKSPVEFAKPDRFVICDKDYALTVVTADQLKQLISQSRSFLKSVEQIVSDHAGIPV